MKYPFRFTVIAYYADFDETPVKETGMGVCTSYTDAATQLEDHYRGELLSIEKLELFEETELIHLPEDICVKYAKNKLNYSVPYKEEE